jgi:hypothetical protein
MVKSDILLSNEIAIEINQMLTDSDCTITYDKIEDIVDKQARDISDKVIKQIEWNPQEVGWCTLMST